ncbi:hypothetical protein M2281_004712 [Mesorhizobium soli]|jgi:hypothetical protein|uniref:DUF3108 domain-containing protein n=1 Tax=Pseudaminobacter soli (ex Li et al. 2025) TaxID=1295366 RepID=UPI002475CB75|nr:DUF3108 domain-containing protein [Mesorhizobium soli]MDH6234098.1 hypothetical protein [Mesorhizobium soli]
MANIFPTVSTAAAVIFVSLYAEAASAASFRSEYVVSYLGLTIARSKFESSFDGDKFSVSGSMSSAGIAQIFDDTKGTVKTTGSFAGNDPRPEGFVTNYTSGKKKKKTEIGFSGASVGKVVNIPPLDKHGDDWVPVSDGDLRAVTDPLSATLIRADKPENVCGRTVKMFDGEMRANLVLSYVSTGPISIPGYSGDAIVCSARFVPVGGYKKNHKSIEYLKNRAQIAISFAPVGSTGVYAPIYATVGTQIGTITIQARKFEALD